MQRNRKSVTLSPRQYDTKGLPTRYFHPGELENLLHLYESGAPKTIVEFGVNTGRNAVAALRNIEGLEFYVGVDVTPDYKTIMPVQRKEIPPVPGELALGDPRFSVIVKPRGSFDLSANDLPQCDAVFIDADHSRQGVLNDRALALQILRKGGVIIYHDDNCLPAVQVTETLNELCKEGADIVHVKNTWLAYEVV